jgi:hypothetical protein
MGLPKGRPLIGPHRLPAGRIRERLASWPSAGEWTLGRHAGLAVTQARSARAPRRRIFFVNARNAWGL